MTGHTVAVTGATGFLGRYAVDALLRSGAHVVGVVRNPDRVPSLAARGVEMRRADLADRKALAAGFAGADAVVSNAALFSLGNRRWEDHERANVEGTQNVFDALADAGVRRAVHVSSVAVYRGHQPPMNEDAPQLGPDTRRTPTNVYSISKAVSEQLAWRLARERGIELTAVRPCAIYGAFDPNFTRIFRRLIGLPVTVMPAWFHLALVYAGDVADGIVRALERPASVGRVYNLTGDDVSVWSFADAWRAAGGPSAQLMVPIPVPMTRVYDTTRARTELGWSNRSYVDALRETFALEAQDGASASR
ncbi:MAG TPA: NAD-dependent epimerase/dehydratase family protein [Candidatus Binatia bacterium]|nr:NAD-dependent epimerase/dehydratase family protein [Candidatus Binatia bacterium]